MFLVALSRFPRYIGGLFLVLIAVAIFSLCFLSPIKRKVKIVVN